MVKNKSVQVFRGVAITAVLLFHFDESIFSSGYLGVDIFFVISGFVVTPKILEIYSGPNQIENGGGGRGHHIFEFYRRRFWRLIPALIANLFVITFLVQIFINSEYHQRFYKQLIATLLIVGNLGAYKFSGDYFSPNPNPLIHMWSLSVEEQIYLLIPILLFIVGYKKKNEIIYVKILYISITVISLFIFLDTNLFTNFYNNLGFQDVTALNFYSPFSRIWQFTFGGLAYFASKSIRFKARINPIFKKIISGFALLIVLSPSRFHGVDSSVVAVIGAGLILILNDLSFPRFIQSQLTWIGNRSYSIYLIHLPIIHISMYSPLFHSDDREIQLIYGVLGLGLSLSIGAVIYNKVETKFRLPRSKQIKSKDIYILIALLIVLFSLSIISKETKYVNPVSSSTESKAPWNWDKNCYQYFQASAGDSKPCTYGKSFDQTLLLIGDSHAASQSQAIVEMTNRLHMKAIVYTKIGCGFILNHDQLNKKYSYPYLTRGCELHNKNILRIVRENNPSIIVFAHRNSSIMIQPNNSQSRVYYNEKLLENLKKLAINTSNLIIIGSESEYLPANTLAQKILGIKGEWSQVPNSDNKFWLNSNLGKIAYIDSLKLLCPKDRCISEFKNRPIFFDSNHLNYWGSRLLINELEKDVKILVTRK